MRITTIDRYFVTLPFVQPIVTSYGALTHKMADIIVIRDDFGNVGYGELTALEYPDYIEETLSGERLISEQCLIPLLRDRDINHPIEVKTLFSKIKGHNMAKSSLETAVWDLYAKQQKSSLSSLIGGTRTRALAGVSLGMMYEQSELVNRVSEYVEQGYQRVKLKVSPDWDVTPVTWIREAFPELPLIVDANSSYTWAQKGQLQTLDELGIVMLEQPFNTYDFLEHAKLQKLLNTRVCLDENIRRLDDCRLAEHLGSCRSINLKIPRVGGLTEALDILKFCREHDISVWLGGMYETGIGRALNVQFSAMSALKFPGDLAASSHYFKEDVIQEQFTVDNGSIEIPRGYGIGVSLK
ncbi:o-succinylbenzoate synthase [Vagococcus vulneris]|uniref:o-succinylbenzoate synthase n=1 Tax=Vagococcus vulneris TaxID=1977869 RepID=A0A429ZY88_9ENTE|nr:o-succinylbenzoate synthase [Vagococcus vulneris]RST98915.1 o-succinylbenzoate synthase [Vagococcus vulneris]